LGGLCRIGAWYGGTLGSQNAEANRNRFVPEGSYPFGLFIGFQPETALPLLRDVAAGTPQRFVYNSTVDPTKPLHTYRPATAMPERFEARPEKLHL
jgi:hypothetical protein